MTNAIPLFTVGDVRRETGIHEGAVRRWLADGDFPSEIIDGVRYMNAATYERCCAHARQRKGVRTPLKLIRQNPVTPEEAQARRETAQGRAQGAPVNKALARVLEIRARRAA